MERVSLPIISSLDARGINGAVKQLSVLGKTMQSIGSVFKAATPAILAFQTAQAGLRFAKDSVVQARDLERNYAALDVVFGDLAGSMRQFTVDAQNIGLSQSDAARASTFLGSVLKQAGFDMATVSEQTQNLVSLASDLAITYGYDVSEALTGMTALFRGEYDPIEKFGVAMKQSEVNAILAANGQDKLTGAARRNAEQIARLALLMQRTKDAQGQFTEQGDTLFASQTKLAASFENLQAAVGQALIPVLSQAMQQIEPMVKSLFPQLGAIFGQIATGIAALVPYLPALFQQVQLALTIVGELFKTFSFLLPIILDNAVAVGAFALAFKAVTFVTPIIQGLRVQFALLQMEMRGGAAAATLFGSALKSSLGVVGLVAAGFGLVAYAITKVATEQHLTESSTISLNKKLAATGGWQAYTTAAGQAAAATAAVGEAQKMVGKSTTLDEFKYQKGLAKAKNAKSPFQQMLDDLLKNFENIADSTQTKDKAGKASKTLFQTIAEEVDKQRLSKYLKNRGASEGLINAIMGSEDWKKTAQNLINGPVKTLTALQNQFNKTKAGADELAAAQAELTKKIEEFNSKADAARDSIFEAFGPLGAIGKSKKELGEFESEVVSLGDAISESLTDAFKDGVISSRNFDDINKFIKDNTELLAANARQRDALAKKRSLVEDLMGDVRSTFMSFANLSAEIETQSETITESSVRMIDGLRVTVSRTYEVTKQTSSVADNFRTMVDKARNFVNVLKQLKASGLNAELFKQIVDSGVEAGTATAEGLLAGGPAAITEVNSLFTELQAISESAAEMTAVVMYNNGVEVAGGFLNGIKSQEQAFADMATTLAESFATALKSQVSAAIDSAKSAVAGGGSAVSAAQETLSFRLGDIKLGAKGSSSIVDQQNAALAQQLIKDPRFTAWGTTINVKVDAGLISDKQAVGEEITKVLTNYARTNGSIVSKI